MDVSEEEEELRRMQELEKSEPLLRENPRRFVLFPIQHSDIWQFYKKAVGEERVRWACARCLVGYLASCLVWRQE